MPSYGRTSGNNFKLKKGRFSLAIKKNFFKKTAVKHCNRLPREVVGAPSLETLQVGLDSALRNLV